MLHLKGTREVQIDVGTSEQNLWKVSIKHNHFDKVTFSLLLNKRVKVDNRTKVCDICVLVLTYHTVNFR